MGIPEDKEMTDFRGELECQGVSEVQRDLNKGIYAPGSWKCKEIQRYIEDENKRERCDYQSSILKLSKERNLVSWFALIVSVIAIGFSLASYF